ncbi:MAG TPA: ferritin-like domain-containing protein [Opitutaceae bacterium]|nr:ferritin-like domain-containing protein [Opitutaceae bacterium]
MPSIESLHDLFVEEVKDLYNAETQLTHALPKLAKAASHEELATAFRDHLKETEGHKTRLERIAEMHDFSPKGKKCLAMEGLVAEGAEAISEKAPSSVKDAALICAAQKVEHYEIAGYGTVRTFAELLGYEDAAKLLAATLEEEGAADKKLTSLAENINVEAEQTAGTGE